MALTKVIMEEMTQKTLNSEAHESLNVQTIDALLWLVGEKMKKNCMKLKFNGQTKKAYV